jgi:hypothetical protein
MRRGLRPPFGWPDETPAADSADARDAEAQADAATPRPGRTSAPATCDHLRFVSQVRVSRLTQPAAQPGPVEFMADVTIECAECGAAFEFMGLPSGVNLQGAAVSPDHQEARLAIRPPRLLTT